MAVNSLQIPQIGTITPDITPQLSQLVATINAGQKRQSLAEIGKGIADGSIDYRTAAGRIAGMGDIGDTLKFLALAEAKDKLGREQAASQQFMSGLSSILGGAGNGSPGQPSQSGATVPNDSNAIPGTVGMNQRLADLSQDFIQDHPGTFLSSGSRTPQQQAALYAERASNPNPVAVPGTSLHERGLAADIGGMTPDDRAALPQYGLSQPVPNDPVHVQLSQSDISAQPSPGVGRITAAAIPHLVMALANRDLPAGQKEVAKLFLTRALDDSKPSEKVQYLQQLADLSGFQGTPLELEMQLRQASKPQMTVDQRTESGEAKAAGEAAGKRRADMFAAANSAIPALANLTRVKTLLDQVSQGKLEPSRMTISAWAKSLGVDDNFAKSIGLDPKGVGSAQALQSLVNELVVGKLGAGGFPSNNFSDSDREFLTDIFPKLGNDPRANAIILETARRARQANIDRVLAYQAWADDPANKNKSFERFEFDQARTAKNMNRFGDLRQQAETLLESAPSSQSGNANGINWKVIR
jgi:hypothetical protein